MNKASFRIKVKNPSKEREECVHHIFPQDAAWPDQTLAYHDISDNQHRPNQVNKKIKQINNLKCLKYCNAKTRTAMNLSVLRD